MKTQEIENEIKLLCIAAEAKLDPIQIETVLDYVESGECRVAIEMFCDFVAEHRIALSPNDLARVIELAKVYDQDVGLPRYQYLHDLAQI